MRVVIDCNVLVSAARIDGVCRAVIDTVVRHHEIVLSEPILADCKVEMDYVQCRIWVSGRLSYTRALSLD